MFSKPYFILSLLLIALMFSCNKEEAEPNNPNPIEPTQWFVDADLDGFGNPDTNLGRLSIQQPLGFIEDNNDCDDSNIDINPNAEEDAYDGIDSNCDGVDEQIIESLSLNFGGTSADYAAGVFQTSTGDFVIGGSSNNPENVNFLGAFDFYLVKTTQDGEIIWEKRYGGPDRDFAEDFYQTSDGGFIMCGRSYSEEGNVRINFGEQDWWILKLDNEGNIVWELTLGGIGDDVANSVIETMDNGYLIAGTSSSLIENSPVSGRGEDAWLVKLDNQGNLLWANNYGGTGTDKLNSILELANGEIILNASTTSIDGDVTNKNSDDQDLWVLKLSATGGILWQNTFGGSEFDMGEDMVLSANDDIVISGETFSSDGNIESNQGKRDGWVINISENGLVNWSKTFGSSFTEFLFSISLSEDNGYFVSGSYAWDDSSNGALWLMNLDDSGNIIWENTFGGSEFDQGADVKSIGEEGIIVAGQSSSTNGDISSNIGDVDIWFLKLKPNGKL